MAMLAGESRKDSVEPARSRELPRQHIEPRSGSEVEHAIEVKRVRLRVGAANFVRRNVEREVLAQSSGLHLDQPWRAVLVERSDVIP